MLLHSAWASSRYFYVPVTLVLLALLGAVRAGTGRPRAVVSAVLLAIAIVHGLAAFPIVRWQPGWPRWGEEVRLWEATPDRPLQIWPPPWTIRLRPHDPDR
jgi:hypothetical protein